MLKMRRKWSSKGKIGQNSSQVVQTYGLQDKFEQSILAHHWLFGA
jgi:hypothetical protein